jgi:hypothetical protein
MRLSLPAFIRKRESRHGERARGLAIARSGERGAPRGTLSHDAPHKIAGNDTVNEVLRTVVFALELH